MVNNSVSKTLSDWLDSYLNFERLPKKNIFWLDTIEFLCKRLNNPQNEYKSIHIAGSKGKGSVSALISSILKENGLSCGLYTSPHILELIERITEAGSFFPESVYEAAFREMVPRIESIIPEQLPNEREITWFELMTLYSFLCFKHAGCSWAVFETGMGGRLDATNVIKPELCLITPIELEHTEYLGNTIPLIAGEKAGIIKQGIPVFLSHQKEEALEVFKKKAEEKEAQLYYYDDLIKTVDYKLPDLSNTKDCKMHVRIETAGLFSRPLDTDLHLIGKVQGENAALAAAAVKHLLPDIEETVIERGLSKARLPGRFEIRDNPFGSKKMILDGAHTENSMKGTVDSFSRIFKDKAHLLFACASDKDFHLLLKTLFNGQCDFSEVTLTRPGEIKKSDLKSLSEYFEDFLDNNPDLKKNISYKRENNYGKAIKEALEDAGRKDAVLLVTGSFYLVSEVKKILNSQTAFSSITE
ncbi:MAG: bifunctional folylpolyglutamate synthase/dihydrofolate synthase [Treponemataceae bacterium]|nr:bifunctional folylpolyglutamate synthase/dihydrofolate synthase [Treponemataceae bacterium]